MIKVATYLKTTKGRFVAAAILLLIILILWFIYRPVTASEDKLLNEYLKTQNDSLKAANKRSDTIAIRANHRADSLEAINRGNSKQIIRIIEDHETIIHHYDTADIAEKQRFFDTRYPAD